MEELELKIRESLPRLQKIERGQRFKSEYYGIITATQIKGWGKGVFSIYGFDEEKGLPRDCYYPRDLELMGHPIKLNDVLEYIKMKDVPIYDTTEPHLIMIGSFYWDLSSPFLADQSEQLKEFLNKC